MNEPLNSFIGKDCPDYKPLGGDPFPLLGSPWTSFFIASLDFRAFGHWEMSRHMATGGEVGMKRADGTSFLATESAKGRIC